MTSDHTQAPLWVQERHRDRNDAQEAASEARMNNLKPGPNSWADVGPNDFGRHFDYSIIDRGTNFVLVPECEAALQWCYHYLPETTDRWANTGFIINRPLKHKLSMVLLNHLQSCGLRSEDDAMAENGELMRQWP